MDKELKDRWIEALRSGDYKQGCSFLCVVNDKDVKQYCCLGVLAEIEDDLEPEEGTCFMKTKVFAYDGNTSTLNISYKEKYGLTHETCSLLMDMNDTGKSFTEISDWIEANL